MVNERQHKTLYFEIINSLKSKPLTSFSALTVSDSTDIPEVLQENLIKKDSVLELKKVCF
jgi:hypothetical protein